MSSEEGKLFLGGLNFNNDEQVLQDHFSSFEVICEVAVVKDQKSQRSWGFGFITFTNPEHASHAMQSMNGSPWKATRSVWTMQGSRGGAFGGHGHGGSYSRGCGDQGYRSSRYDSWPGGYRYGHGHGHGHERSRVSGGRNQCNYGLLWRETMKTMRDNEDN